MNYLIGTGVVVACCFVIPALAGFGTAGIVGGSIAAGVQSVIGIVVGGSVFAIVQSLGATGVLINGVAVGISAASAGIIM